MKHARSIFRFLVNAARRGERTVLVTLVAVEGSASRAPGTHMAVSETGAFAGSMSGGCVEAAVVGEAQRVLASGAAELVRFGAGSRYMDIRLPCGGGIDLLFSPDPSLAVIEGAYEALEARNPVELVLGLDGAVSLADQSRSAASGAIHVRHEPDLRLMIVGHGAEPEAFARLGTAHGADVRVLSPDDKLVARLAASGIDAVHLRTPAPSPHLVGDSHSAIIFLFHDHDWESALLRQALGLGAFFVGAMGSRATHRRRVAALADAGVTQADIDRIVGPLGLIPATRDPETLALSALSQIVAMQSGPGNVTDRCVNHVDAPNLPLKRCVNIGYTATALPRRRGRHDP